jgi:HSP20 family molecular chaperone IbpA
MSIQQLIGDTLHMLHTGEDDLSIRDALNRLAGSTGVNSIDNYWKPPCDLVDTDDLTTVYLDIPGVDLNTIDVDFKNNKLSVKGERMKPYNEDESTRNEVMYGKFERKVNLPISVTNRENVKVTAKGGVLTITIDKAKEGEHNFSVRLNDE